MTVAIVSLICRVLHIASTCTQLGGVFYARTVLWPTLDLLDPDTRKRFLEGAIRRFAIMKWTGVVVGAVTGIFQWTVTYPHIIDHARYVIFFAIKMIGAFGLFSITFLLALPDERLNEMRIHRGVWSGLNICCGAVILIGAALMHTVARH